VLTDCPVAAVLDGAFLDGESAASTARPTLDADGGRIRMIPYRESRRVLAFALDSPQAWQATAGPVDTMWTELPRAIGEGQRSMRPRTTPTNEQAASTSVSEGEGNCRDGTGRRDCRTD
jgi:hypothetical protein